MVLLAMACAPDDPPVEVCGNGFDDDADAFVDCQDADCAGPSCVEQCVDVIDNDGDALADCLDPDCDGGCPEVCADTRDNDGDGLLDCADPECVGALPEACDDGGADDDCDALVDCADPDCDGGCPEVCADTRDNDGDALRDCDDPDCDGDPVCPESCFDGRDNDLDSLTDCADEACDAVCDLDLDGFDVLVGGGTDCDDTRPEVNPAAAETCNSGVDDDCDGLADDADPNLATASTDPFYLDDDGDGYGSTLDGAGCDAPPGWSTEGGDCDDADPYRHPGLLELCGTPDDDCDGLVDNDDPDLDPTGTSVYYQDVDGDGYGDAASARTACTKPEGYVDNGDDCHLFDPAISFETEWWPDGDGDGYGAGIGVLACARPIDHVDNAEDCDDLHVNAHPGVIGDWPSLRAGWQADGTVAEATGSLPDAVLVGDATFGEGRYGESFLLDGAGDRVEITFSWTKPFTLSLWVKAGVLPQPDAGLLATAVDASADDTFELRLLDTDRILFHSNLVDVDAGAVTTEWVHVAVSYDGSILSTYNGGLPVATATWLAATPPSFVGIVLGVERTGTFELEGQVDDLLVFDHALKDTEVGALADGTASCLAF